MPPKKSALKKRKGGGGGGMGVLCGNKRTLYTELLDEQYGFECIFDK